MWLKKRTNEAEIPFGQDFHHSLEAHGDHQNPKMIIHFTVIFKIIFNKVSGVMLNCDRYFHFCIANETVYTYY